jgi:heme a synthase
MERLGLPRWLDVVLLANLVVEVAIVVTGGLVRLTGSGLGCPTWPECVPGSFTPVLRQPEGVHKYIEFGNRTLTSVAGLAALAALVGTVLVVRRGRPAVLVRWAALPLIGVLAQAVLGGVTVLTHLHPATVAAHFLLSMALVSVSTYLLLRVRSGDGTPVRQVRPEISRMIGGLVALTAVVLALGTVVTGSGPHSGDADQPARLGLDPRAASWLHSDAVLVWFGLLGAVLVGLHFTQAPAAVTRAARVLLAVGLLQGAVGYLQYATGLPVVAVAGHMLGASLMVVAVTWLVGTLVVRSPALDPG